MSESLMQNLVCPLCGKEVPELIYKLEKSLQERIVDAILDKRPEWMQKDGLCLPCLNYYQNLTSRPNQFKKIKFKIKK
jgi:hypothetical protein